MERISIQLNVVNTKLTDCVGQLTCHMHVAMTTGAKRVKHK